MKNNVHALFLSAALALSFLSTTYAHAAPQYICAFENSAEKTRYELRIREQTNAGTFTYSFAPDASQPAVQGKFEVTRTSTTWSHFIFTGKDAQSNVKLSVPAGLDGNSVYLEMEITVGEFTLDQVRWLNCTSGR
ncbi:MAG: hypothetical protein FJY29_00040 [Betaproteobacteria bacterium]|nr:hypothetical protein [Betaproteobacteria bacterium]